MDRDTGAEVEQQCRDKGRTDNFDVGDADDVRHQEGGHAHNWGMICPPEDATLSMAAA